MKRGELRHPSEYPLVLERPGNHGDYVQVLFADGHVETVGAARVGMMVIKPIRDQFGGAPRRLRRVLSELKSEGFPADRD